MSAIRLLLLLLLLPLATQCAAQDVVDVASPDVALRDAAFEPGRLQARRKALLALLPKDAIVIVSAGPRGSDLMPFRPRPDFLYLSGQREAELTLLLSAEDDVLFVPPKDERHELWNGRRISPGSPEAAASGFGEVLSMGAPRIERLRAALARGGPLYVSGVDTAVLERELGRAVPVQGASSHIARLRGLKDEHEVALLERAIGITCSALDEAIRSVEPGFHEFEAQSVIEYVFARYGAQRPGFASIVGSGPNTCTIHYQDNRRRMAAGDLLIMDVGAELWGYTADVTRTVPVSGKFTKRQRDIYELVLRAQEAGFAAVKPGATIPQVHAAARAVIAKAGYAAFFQHGTSHWLGMDVHDVGAYDRQFEVGMVLTVEPGIYLADEALGVRIEDDVVVTKDGYRLLSGGVPRDPEAIEALMARKGVGNAEVSPPPAMPPAGQPAREPETAPPGERREF